MKRLWLCAPLLALVPLLGWHSPPQPPGRYEKEVAAFEARDALGMPAPGGIVFVGSSSIGRWDLKTAFPGRGVIRRGLGGSELADAVHYVDRLVLAYRPAVVVLYAGDNDLAQGKGPFDVARDFDRFCAKVRAGLPKARIVFIGIKPSISRWRHIEKIRTANTLIRERIAADPAMAFVDVEPAMLGPEGRPRPELYFQDGLHLSRSGYRLWSDLVRPHLDPPPSR